MDLLEYYTWTRFFELDLLEISDSDRDAAYLAVKAWNKSWELRLRIQAGAA